jgi:hypothetical protein
MKLKKSLAAAAALALGLAVTTAIAAEVTRTYVKDSYKFTCVKMGDGEYCGNFNVVSGG